MKYLFLDTNIFLHFKDFEDISWGSLSGVNDDFCICIAPTVLDELDDQKDSGRGKIQKRAKKYSSKLFDILMKSKTSKCKIIQIQEYTPTDNDARKLDIHKKDNLILLSALHSGYNISDIIIISADKHILLKAHGLNLGYLQMPEEYQLHEEDIANKVDEKKEIGSLANTQQFFPKLKITFPEEQSTLAISRPPIVDEKARLNDAIDTIKLEVPQKQYVEPTNTLDFLARIATLPFNTKESVERYNQDREEYLKEEYAYNHLRIQKETLDKRFRKLTFEVVNAGEAPSGDMAIVIEIPERVKLYTTKDSLECFDCTSPLKPSSNLMLPRETLRAMTSFQQGYGKTNFWLWNPNKPIKKHKYVLEPESLMHNFKRELGLSLYIDTLKESSFSIKWSAQASNAPTIDEGEIMVNID